jgi:phenylacetate-CoA ligase
MKSINIKDMNMGTTANGIKHAFVKRVLSPSKKYSTFLHRSQWWTTADLQDLQLQNLKSVVKSAFTNVPYYRGTMQVFNVRPKDIHSLDDLALMPFVEKDIIRRRGREFLSSKASQIALYQCNTSGTTGTPLSIYRDLRNIGFEYAMLSRQREWAGLVPGDRYATLKGEMFAKRNINKGDYWDLNAVENKLIMSSYHLAEQTAHRYIDALEKFKPLAIDGYPSSIYTLAKFMLDRDIVFPMKAILTSSETIAPEQKDVIEQAFDCRVFDYYGMAERVAAIHTCESGHYHVVPEYSIVEFVRNGTLSDEYFEIVGTALNNDAMPLIRYRVGDIAKVTKTTCACGRNYPVIDGIIGRTDDYIVTPNGKMVGRLDHIFKSARNLIQAQLYQPHREKIILRVVPDRTFTKKDGEKILEKLYKRVGDGISFEIKYMPYIPRTRRGKIKSVISEVEIYNNSKEENPR